jgi:Uma2 family endonuclease
MALEKREAHTIEHIENLPQGKRAELIDGEIYMMSAPNTRHQRISGFLHIRIGSYIESRKGKCEVFASPFAVYLSNDQYNYVEPDLSVICDLDKLDEKGCHGAPDLVIEIVSPGSRQMDYLVKLLKYQQAGVREYWIVDPIDESIMVYFFEKERMEKYTFQDNVKVNIYEELSIDFSELNS